MKKIAIIFFVVAINFLSLNAQEKDIKNYNTEHIEQFYFKKGLKEGTKKGYKDGYKDGIRFAKKQLRLYKTKIMAIEAGKYLKEYEGKITNPEIYQIRKGRETSVIVRGCKIEKSLTPDEIIDLPHYPIDAHGNTKFNYYNIDETSLSPFDDSKEITNSADVISRDGNGFYANRPSNPYTNNGSYYYLENTNGMRKKLDVLNYSYAIENNKLKVIFTSEKEKKAFMKRVGF